MKQMVSFILALVICIGLLPVTDAAAVTTSVSGTHGDHVTWELASDGTLTLSGTGEVAYADYDDELETNAYPWVTYRDQVTKIVIGEGITRLPNAVFANYINVTEIVMPGTLAEIEGHAFFGTAITRLEIPEGVKYLGTGCFGYSEKLEYVQLPSTMEFISDWTFDTCTSLKTVIMPEMPNLEYINEGAFYGCTSLTSLDWYTADILYGYLFANCIGLVDVTIPEGVEEVYYMAFRNCTNLKRMVFPTTLNALSSGIFDCEDGHTMDAVIFQGNAPTIESDAFYGLTATCYYPAGDATWTADVRQNYEGNITWKPYTVTSITTQPKTQKVKAGTKATFSVVAAGTNLSYQWQFKKTADGSWSNCTASGNKTATMQVDATTSKSAYYYRCKITDGTGNTVTSNVVRLYVLGIKTQPTTQKVKAGTTATFTVSATGANKTYQWQYKTSSDGNWLSCTAEGNKTATLKVAATTGKSSYYYRCQIKDNGGNTVYTNAVRLYVLGIKTQPTTQKVKAGTTATFKVSATGLNKTYQWQYKTSADGSWQNCTATGNKTATLKVSATTGKSGYYYRCIIKDDGGNTVTTNAVRLYVLGITTQPAAKTAKAGTTVKFTVAATGAGKTYQWQYKTPEGTWKNTTATGAKKATLSVSVTAAKNGYQYRCIVKDNAGNSVTSNAAKLTVK